MKKEIKGFIVGCLVSIIGLTTVFAAGGIKSAQFNSNKVVYNGNALDLSSQPMVSVTKDGEINSSNYMPVRAVLEQMGYNVRWDGNSQTVTITTNDYDIMNPVPSTPVQNTSTVEQTTTPTPTPTVAPTPTPKLSLTDDNIALAQVAIDNLKDSLKNHHSLILNNIRIYRTDNGNDCVEIDYHATNSYGGLIRGWYVYSTSTGGLSAQSSIIDRHNYEYITVPTSKIKK